MFVWRASTVMNMLKDYLPKSHEGLARIAGAWGSGDQQKTIDDMKDKLEGESWGAVVKAAGVQPE